MSAWQSFWLNGTDAWAPPIPKAASDTEALTLGEVSTKSIAVMQRIVPSGFLTGSQNISGFLADIIEDPDSPDAGWLIGGRNLVLDANQAGIETDASGWEVITSCTLARSTAQARSGVASLQVTKIAGQAYMAFRPAPYTSIPVNVGQEYTITAYFKGATNARNYQVWMDWANSGGGHIGGGSNASTPADNSAWAAISVTGTAPAGAVYLRPALQVNNVPDGEVHYTDDLTVTTKPVRLRLGFNSPSTNLVPGFRQEIRIQVRPGT